MKFNDAKKLRDDILSSIDKKEPFKPNRFLGNSFQAEFSKLSRTEPKKHIAIGYAYDENDPDEVKLQIRAITQTVGMGVAEKIHETLGEKDSKLKVYRNIKISTGCTDKLRSNLLDEPEGLVLGASIGSTIHSSTGSIGGFVWNENDDMCVLSNFHVIAGSPNSLKADKGQNVIHPGLSDLTNSTVSDNVIAKLYRFVVFTEQGINESDSAVAIIDEDKLNLMKGNYIPSFCGEQFRGKPVNYSVRENQKLYEGMPVYKVGRSTGFTKGILSATSLNGITIRHVNADIRFNNIVEIDWENQNAPFSSDGDSGSLIFIEREGNLLGTSLLFATGEVRDYNANRYRKVTYGCSLKDVLKSMKCRWINYE